MKRMKPMVILTAVFVSAVSISATSSNIYATEKEAVLAEKEMVTKEIYLTEEEVFEALANTFDDQVLQKKIEAETDYSPSGAKIKSFDAEDYSEYTENEYGGMYLDDNGQLVVCYVTNSDTMKAAKSNLAQKARSNYTAALTDADNETVIDNYTFKEVKYSEKELLDAYEIVNKTAEKNDVIRTVDIDVFQNRIVIGIEDINDLDEIKDDLVDIDGMYALDTVTEEFHEMATINGTSQISNDSGYSTPAGKLYISSLKTYGIVTCGHGWAVGDKVYYGNTVIGSTKYRTYNSTNDSSVFLLNSGHSYKDTRVDQIDSSVPVVGSTLTLRGYKSGKISGAKVLSINSSVKINSSLTCTGLIKTDKTLQPGDSGGGAIGKYADGGRTALILGINKGGTSSSSWLVKGQVICNAYK